MSWVAAGVTAAVAIGGAIKSFDDAAKQRRAQDEADDAAARMFEDARGKLETNFFEALSIAKEPYELQREASLAAGAQAIEAAREGDVRGVGATAGRVQMAQEEAQAKTRAAMAQEMQKLEQITAQEESRLRDVGVQLDLAEAEGAQDASAAAAMAAAEATRQGTESLGQAAIAVGGAIPAFQKTKGARQINRAKRQFRKSDEAAMGMSFLDYSLNQASMGKGILAGLEYGNITSQKDFEDALYGIGGIIEIGNPSFNLR
ncbi:MAG: hypothetical protein JSW41_05315 [Candidatus Aenigmatarchaeota archaeon]|nr:MAG: hypothetical protein JSW41_05315 [Candidatus Aenigmarchaeota archaeon]